MGLDWFPRDLWNPAVLLRRPLVIWWSACRVAQAIACHLVALLTAGNWPDCKYIAKREVDVEQERLLFRQVWCPGRLVLRSAVPQAQ